MAPPASQTPVTCADLGSPSRCPSCGNDFLKTRAQILRFWRFPYSCPSVKGLTSRDLCMFGELGIFFICLVFCVCFFLSFFSFFFFFDPGG